MDSPLIDSLVPVWAALEEGLLEEAWEAAEPLRPQLGHSREVARVWLKLLAASPEREGRVEELRQVLAAWPAEPRLVLAASELLLQEEETAPLDEPREEQGPAAQAAEALARCLESAQWGEGPESQALRAALQVRRGSCLRLLGPDRDAEARAAFEAGLELQPGNAGAWYDAGLCHKYAGRFAEGLAANLRALERHAEDTATLWNAAICATGAGQAEEAVRAWNKLGLPAKVGADGYPRLEGIPMAQVRLSTAGPVAQGGMARPGERGDFEYLWVQPHSPCHGELLTPTLYDLAADVGDLVLWDGAPLGFRRVGNERVPRFPMLAVLARGRLRAFRFFGTQEKPGQVAALEELLPEGSQVYVHTEQVVPMCAACARGDVGEPHRHEHASTLVQGKLVVPPEVALGDFRRYLEAVVGAHPQVRLLSPALLRAVGDETAARQAEQLIETLAPR